MSDDKCVICSTVMLGKKWEMIVEDLWNYFADDFNQWSELSKEEKDTLINCKSVSKLLDKI